MWYLIVSIPDLCNLTYFDIATIIDNNSKRTLNLRKDVPRPLINGLWGFLFQKIDVKCVKRARRAATSASVNAFIVNVNKGLKPVFLEQHINIVKYSHASKPLI